MSETNLAGTAAPGASSPTPSAPTTEGTGTTPSGAATPPASASPAPTGYENLGLPDDDVIEIPEAEAPTSEAEQAQPTSPEAQPPQAQAEAKPAEPAPAVKPPAAPQEPAQAKPPEQPAPASVEPQGLVQQLDQHREAVISALAADKFGLTKQEAEALELNAAEAIPRLMARTYYQATQSALLHIQNFVPGMVVNLVKAMQAQKEAEDAFYGAHKHLDRGKHAKDVQSFNQAFRAANPQISMEDLQAMVAAAVTAKFGLQPNAAAKPNGGAPPPQPRVPPFVPATAGVQTRVSPEPENAFMGLGRDYDDE